MSSIPDTQDTTHTPGPWKIEFASESLIAQTKVVAGTRTVARAAHGTYMLTPEAEANARLIAAAPRMHDYLSKRAAEGDAEAAEILEAIHATR